jgi:uncharacterized surface anchored protein
MKRLGLRRIVATIGIVSMIVSNAADIMPVYAADGAESAESVSTETVVEETPENTAESSQSGSGSGSEQPQIQSDQSVTGKPEDTATSAAAMEATSAAAQAATSKAAAQATSKAATQATSEAAAEVTSEAAVANTSDAATEATSLAPVEVSEKTEDNSVSISYQCAVDGSRLQSADGILLGDNDTASLKEYAPSIKGYTFRDASIRIDLEGHDEVTGSVTRIRKTASTATVDTKDEKGNVIATTKTTTISMEWIDDSADSPAWTSFDKEASVSVTYNYTKDKAPEKKVVEGKSIKLSAAVTDINGKAIDGRDSISLPSFANDKIDLTASPVTIDGYTYKEAQIDGRTVIAITRGTKVSDNTDEDGSVTETKTVVYTAVDEDGNSADLGNDTTITFLYKADKKPVTTEDVKTVTLSAGCFDEDGNKIDGYGKVAMPDFDSALKLNGKDSAPVSIDGYTYKEARIGSTVIDSISKSTKSVTVTDENGDEQQKDVTVYSYAADGETTKLTEDTTVKFIYTADETVKAVTLTAECVDKDGEAIDGYSKAEIPAFDSKLVLNDTDNAPIEIKGYLYREAKIGDDVISSLKKTVKKSGSKEIDVYSYVADGKTTDITDDTKVTFVYEAADRIVKVDATCVDEFGNEIAAKYTNMSLPVFDGTLTLDDKTNAPVKKVLVRKGLFKITNYTYVQASVNGAVIKALKKTKANTYTTADQQYVYSYTTDGSEWTKIEEDTTVRFEFNDGKKADFDVTSTDGKVEVVATLDKPGALPDDVRLVVTPITSGSSGYDYDAYMQALNNNSSSITGNSDTTFDSSNTILYDIAFIGPKVDADGNVVDGEMEYQPTEGAVSISMFLLDSQISDGLGATDASDVKFVHLPLKESVRDSVDTTADATGISAGDINVEMPGASVNLSGSQDVVSTSLSSFSAVALTMEKLGGAASTETVNLEDLVVKDGLTVTLYDDTKKQPIPYGDDQQIGRADSITATIKFEIDNSKKASASGKRIVYDLTGNTGVTFDTKKTDDLYSNGVKVGTFTIESGKIYFDIDKTFIDGQGTIQGTAKIGFTLNSTGTSDSDSITFKFPGTGDITAYFENSKINGSKWYETISGDAEHLWFKIKLSPDAKSNNVKLTDTLGSDFSFVPGTFKLDDILIDSGMVSIDGQKATIELGTLTAGDHYIIYKANILDNSNQNNANNNNAKWIWDTNQNGNADTWVDFSNYAPTIVKDHDQNISNNRIKWVLTVNGDKCKNGLNGAVVTDPLTDKNNYRIDGSRVYDLSVTAPDHSSYTGGNYSVINNILTYNFGEDTVKGNYTITFYTGINASALSVGDNWIYNDATVTQDGLSGSDYEDVNVPYSPIVKSGSLPEGTELITWTVTVNGGTYRQDLSGAELNDSIPDTVIFNRDSWSVTDESGTAYTEGTLSEIDSNGNLKYTFGSNAGSKKYTIRYTTSINKESSAIHGGDNVINNHIELTPVGGDGIGTDASVIYTYEPATITLDKTCITPGSGKTVTAPDTTVDGKQLVYAQWKIDVPITDTENKLGSFYITDTIEQSTNIANQIVFNDPEHPFAVAVDGRTLTSDEFTVASGNGNTDNFKATFTSLVPHKNVTITYYTVSDVTNSSTYDESSSTEIKNDAYARYTYAGSSKEFVKYDSDVFYYRNVVEEHKFHKQFGNWILNDDKSYTIPCYILANADDYNAAQGKTDYGTRKLIITDTMGEGLNYAAGTAKVTIRNGSSTVTEAAFEPTQSGKVLTWDFENCTDTTIKAAAQGKALIYIQYNATVSKEYYSNFNGQTITLTNDANMTADGQDAGSDHAQTEKTFSKLSKSGVQNSGSAYITYTVEINQEKLDLDPNNDSITLTDTIPSEYMLETGSITIKNDAGESVNDGTHSYSYNSSTHVLSFTVPDGEHYTVSYTVEFKVQDGKKHEISNTVTLSGLTSVSSTESEKYRANSASATVTGEAGTISLKKVDASSMQTVLAGAEFKLYRIDNKDNPAGTCIDTQTTDSTGLLTFKQDGVNKLQQDTLYYYQESAAPEVKNGNNTTYYKLDPTKCYFYIAGNSSSKPAELATQIGVTAEEYKDEGKTITVSDSKISLHVEKQDTNANKLQGADLQLMDGENLIAEWNTSSANPKTIDNLAPGNYTIHEKNAPTGYAVAEDIPVTVTKEGIVKIGDTVQQDNLVVMQDDVIRKDVVISKKGLGGEELAGAQLKVTSTDGKKVYDSWTSTATSHTVTGLLMGTYVLTEDTAPAGYEKASSITFVIDAEGKVTVGGKDANGTVTMTDEATKRTVNVSKQDLGNAELSGAELKVTSTDGKTVYDSWTSNDKPHTVAGLVMGTYVLTEDTAPAGYDKASSITFEIDAEGKVTVGGKDISGTVTMTDAETKRTVNISKQDLGGTELAGAELKVTSEDGKTVYDSWTSTDKPHTVTGLVMGTYVLTEDTAPAGYDKASSITFEIDAEGKVTVGGKDTSGTVTMTDAETKRNVDIRKQDVGGVELPGAELKVASEDGKTVYDSWTSTDKPHTVTGLVMGTYTLTEDTAPAGYDKASSITFAIDAEGKVTVGGKDTSGTVTMTDAETKRTVNISKQDLGGTELAGAELKVTSEDGKTVYDSWTSTDKPHTVAGLVMGTYVLTEDTAPAGYDKASSITFEIDAEGKVTVGGKDTSGTVTMTDAETKRNVDIRKQDVGGVELPGAELKVTSEDGKTVYDSWTSTDKPHTVTGLVMGTYTLTETTAPDGYQKAESITFTVTDQGEVKIGEDVQKDNIVTMQDADQKNVTISKVAITGGKELAGASLKVEGTTLNNKPFTDSWTSTGTAHVIEKMPAGTYTLTETTAPDGYQKAESITFTVTDQGKVKIGEDVQQGNTVTMQDADQPNVTISKVAITGGKELAGASLKVEGTTLNNKPFTDSWTSTGTAHVIEKMPAGTYTLTETTAPDGYQKAESITFTVTDQGEVKIGEDVQKDNIVTMQDADQKNVTISKVAITGGKELAGASLKVEGTTLNNKPFTDSWTSTGTAHVIEKMPAGTYTLTETTAPDGYQKAESITFTVTDQGKVKIGEDVQQGNTVTMQDADQPNVTISKVAITGGKELAGASLKVEGTTLNNKPFTDSWTSTGTAHVIEKMPAGDYTLTEIKAPGGYEKAESIRFTVTSDGKLEIGGKERDDHTVVMKDDLTVCSLNFSKTDLHGLEVEGAKLTVSGTQGNGQPFKETWTSKAGAANVHTVKITMGTYTMTEDTTPAGYDHAQSIKFTVDASGKVTLADGTDVTKSGITMIDVLSTGNLVIYKTTNGATTPADTTFTITGPNGYSKTVKYSEFSNGQYKLTKLDPGNYKVVESVGSAAVSGYTLSVTGNYATATITKNNEAPLGITNNYNKINTGSLSIVKTTTGAATPAGTTFTITGPNSFSKTVTYGDFTNGVYTITDLVPGDYTVTEDTGSAAVSGYTLTVTGNGGTATVAADANVSLGITNTYTNNKTGSLMIVKTSAGATTPAGTVFTITGPNGYSKTVTYSQFTGGRYTLTDLVPGTYTVTENRDSAVIVSYALTVTGDGAAAAVTAGKTTTVGIINTYTAGAGNLIVTKISNGTSTPAGTTFTITGPNGFSKTVTYGEFAGGSYMLSNLVPGNYTVTEDSGTAQVANYTLTVSGDGSTAAVTAGGTGTVTITNNYTTTTPKTGSVDLVKSDSENGALLAGAVFDLHRGDGSVYGTYTTDSNGHITVGGLPYGSYYFIETAAPSGYQIDETRTDFTISDGSGVRESVWLNFTNTKTGHVRGARRGYDRNGNVLGAKRGNAKGANRVATGDDSQMVLYGSISAAAAAALVGWILVNRKKKKKDQGEGSN